MTPPGRLAAYLKARREHLRPEDVGLVVDQTTRRVPGLRREEVASLASISTNYYLRLEQGRHANPSPQVLDALARALKLDSVASAYLHGLTRPAVESGAVEPHDVVHESTLWLIDSWPSTAAIVHSRYIDVLASNALAQALNPNYRAGVNGLMTLLHDPWEREFHADWDGLAARSVALLRNVADANTADARLDALVAEGTARSPLFRELWNRQEVRSVGDGTHTLHHPLVGELHVCYLRLPLVGTAGQSLFLYFAEPGTPSADAMELLAQSAWEWEGQERTPARD